MSSSSSYFANAKNFTINNLSVNNNTFVSESDALQLLDKHCATSAMHDSEERYPPPLCHPGTGEAVISGIEGWYGFEIPPQKKIMWVHAPAGFGKSAVAGTVSNKFESRTDLGFNPVGATFFFWRASPERNSPARFIITIAYQLTMSIPELAPYIKAAVTQNPMVLNKTLEIQMTKLIVEPFKSLGELEDMPHRLVIVDGLDECINSDQQSRVEKDYAEDQERVQVRVLDLIYALQSHRLPLCFLIFSRPEPWIKQRIQSKSFEAVTETLDLYKVGNRLKDVEKYVKDELTRIAGSLDPPHNEQWPEKHLVARFLRRAGGNMLYATTVIRHIDDPYDDPRQRLQDILNGDIKFTSDLAHFPPFSCLYELYRQILRSCPRANQAIMIELLEEILVSHTRFARDTNARTALDILDRLSGRAPGRGFKAIRSLHGVIRLSDRSPKPYLDFFYHTSFFEFLRQRDPLLPDLTLNIQKGRRRLLAGCLQSLSAVTLDGQIDEGHVKFALHEWVYLWRNWTPSDKNDMATKLRAFLAIDLRACFIQSTTLLAPGITHLYHPTKNLIFHGKSLFARTPLAGDALEHLRSSVERAILHFLHPDQFLICDQDPLHAFPATYVSRFLKEIYESRPPAFDNLVRALKSLLKEHQVLFDRVEQNLLETKQPHEGRAAVKNIIKIVRQDDT